MLTLLPLLLLLTGEVTGEVAAQCPLPGCEKCEVVVEQEKTDLVLVDWSRAWWDLDLACLNSLSLTLNGESQSQRGRWQQSGLQVILQTRLIYSLGLSSKEHNLMVFTSIQGTD